MRFHCPKTRVISFCNRIKDEVTVIVSEGVLIVPMKLNSNPKGLLRPLRPKGIKGFLQLGVSREGCCGRAFSKLQACPCLDVQRRGSLTKDLVNSHRVLHLRKIQHSLSAISS